MYNDKLLVITNSENSWDFNAMTGAQEDLECWTPQSVSLRLSNSLGQSVSTFSRFRFLFVSVLEIAFQFFGN